MNQFYAPSDQITSADITLSGQEAKHASKVLRKNVGDKILVTDGNGIRYTGVIESVDKDELRASILESIRFKEPELKVEICLGLIRKRDRLEFAVEKATELGVSAISLFWADHSEPFKVRLDRLESAVESAMKQSLRVFRPQVTIFDSLHDVIKSDMDGTLIIQADQFGEGEIVFDGAETNRIILVVGPEGGLSEKEKEILLSKKAVKLSLGDFRLRAETAAVLVAAKFGNKKADPLRSA